MGKITSYPLTVTSMMEGVFIAVLGGLGYSKENTQRFAIAKTIVPKFVVDALQKGVTEFTITTDSPASVPKWVWSIRSEPPLCGTLAFICTHIDENNVAHLEVSRPAELLLKDYECNPEELPIPLERGDGFIVNVPTGMIGDPREWVFIVALNEDYQPQAGLFQGGGLFAQNRYTVKDAVPITTSVTVDLTGLDKESEPSWIL